MKKLLLTIKGIITIVILFGQQLTTPPIPANTRQWNSNYMQTVLFDDFTGSNIDPYKWSANVGAKENQLNIFVNDPLYIKTENGNLQLIARSTPNVTANIPLANGQ